MLIARFLYFAAAVFLVFFVVFVFRSVRGLYVSMERSLNDGSQDRRVHSIGNDKPSLEVSARATSARLDNAQRHQSVNLKRRSNSTLCVKCDSGSMAVGAGGVYRRSTAKTRAISPATGDNMFRDM